MLSQSLQSLTVTNGLVTVGSVPTSTHVGTHTVLSVGALSIPPAGKLDLSNNVLIVHGTAGTVATNLSTVAGYLKSGFNAGSGYWNGSTGIVSTSTGSTNIAATNDTRFLTTLGYRQGDGTSSFEGTTPSATDVIVAYTYYGDADLEREASTGADYAIRSTRRLASEQTNHTAISGWSNGDFNYDGVVNGLDYALIDNTFNQLVANPSLARPLDLEAAASNLIASPAASSAVPEPTTLGLLGIGAIGLLGRRRRRN